MPCIIMFALTVMYFSPLSTHPYRKPKTKTSRSSNKTKPSNNSSKPIKSLEDDWNEDGGWDDAAWDAVEQEVKSQPGGKKD